MAIGNRTDVLPLGINLQRREGPYPDTAMPIVAKKGPTSTSIGQRVLKTGLMLPSSYTNLALKPS